MKTIKYLFTALALTLSVNSFASTRYVSDDIYIYLHSGPSLDYRIIGTLKVGTEVKTLNYNKDTKFMQVKPVTGRAGWVKLADLQKELPAKNLLPVAQEALRVSEEKLNAINEKNSETLKQKDEDFQEQAELVDHLKQEKSLLVQEVTDLKARNLELDLLQETKDSRVKMEWLLNGGGVLFLGLLIGLIIPFLPRRKKRTENW